jgi:predicted alpha/beta hydrolase
METKLVKESIMVTVTAGNQLHIRRIYKADSSRNEVAVLIHGDTENGHIFYSESGRGLACELARRGYDVYVPDLRGKGKSWPSLGPRSTYGYHEAINEDLPAVLKRVASRTHGKPQTWISHSAGGVLLMSCYARHANELPTPKQIVHFGTRRYVSSESFRKRLLIDFLWKKVCRYLVSSSGYLPARSLRLGPANETANSYYNNIAWSESVEWLDPVDDYDYSQAIRLCNVPRSLYFCSEKDTAFGAPEDVRLFMRELGQHDGRMVILSRTGGSMHDYDHVSMLLHPDAKDDHFLTLFDWMNECLGR